MPSWIFTHIDPLPNLVVSCRTDFNNLKVSILPEENRNMKTEDIFHQNEKKDYYRLLKTKEGLQINNSITGVFKLRLKGIFRRKLIIEHDATEYSGMKIL